jgi:hypothetical protein
MLIDSANLTTTAQRYDAMMELQKRNISRFYTISECRERLIELDPDNIKTAAEIRELAHTGKVKSIRYGATKTRIKVDLVSLALYSPSDYDLKRRTRRMKRKAVHSESKAEQTSQTTTPPTPPTLTVVEQPSQSVGASVGL